MVPCDTIIRAQACRIKTSRAVWTTGALSYSILPYLGCINCNIHDHTCRRYTAFLEKKN